MNLMKALAQKINMQYATEQMILEELNNKPLVSIHRDLNMFEQMINVESEESLP